MSTNGAYINTNKPRESIAVAEGDNVRKTPTTTRPEYIKNWLLKQQHASMVVDSVLKYPNKRGGYFIPRVIKINDSATSPYVIEQRAPGKALTKELFEGLSPATQDKLYASLANFVYDMNHCQPILTFEQKLNEPEKTGLDFSGVVSKVAPYLDANDIAAINNAYNFFQTHQNLLSCVALFHGDMNENNIFYDDKTNTVSFIDLAEAKYETMDYIFDQDLKKLPWLDTQKLAARYQEMVRQENIMVKSNPEMLDLYNKMRNLKWSGETMIGNKNPAIYKIVLQDQIKAVTKAYGNVVAMLKQQKTYSL